jgi:hypothetical protein
LWYDLYIKPNDYKKAKLFFIDENKSPPIKAPFLIQLDSFFIENNIYIDNQSTLINDLNDIYINILNKNDFYIHIKNGTKIANSFTLNSKDKLNFDTTQKIISINNNINSKINSINNNMAQLFLNKKRISKINEDRLIGKNDSENINSFGKNNLKQINQKIKRHKSLNDFEQDIENPIYDIYSKAINNFKEKSFYFQIDLLIKEFVNLSNLYWETTSKALKKINSLLLYINKGKKGNLKKRLKTSIILNYLEGSSLYLSSTLNYNRCYFKIFEDELKIYKNKLFN